MIFDSESIESLFTFAQKLIAIDQSGSVEIADLNWARMENWRDLLASTFHTKERLRMLDKTSRVHILYNASKNPLTPHPQIQALYLQGWLATQLEWKFQTSSCEKGRWNLCYEYQGRQITLTLYPENQENLKPGSIISVNLETIDQDHFSFGCNLDMPHHVSMRFSTLKKCDVPLKYIFGKEESGKSLVKEICHRGTSKHFLNLLERLEERKEFSLCEH